MNQKLADYKKIQVHGGKFHMDDVMCVILAMRANPEIEVVRGGEPMVNDDDTIVADYGNTEFDHHDQGKIRTYEDGIKMSACGLMMEKFGEELFPDEYVRRNVLKNVIKGIDAIDNGQTGMIDNIGVSMTDIVRVFNGTWDSRCKDGMKLFYEAVSVTKVIFEKEIERIQSNERAENIITDAYEKAEDKHIIVFEQYVPAKEYFAENTEDVKFIIFPSNRGGYTLATVPPDMDHIMEQRCSIAMSGKDAIEGVTFIHQNLFIAATETVESAVALAKYSILEND